MLTMKMSTHRHVEVHCTLDIMEAKARIWRRSAANLARIGNQSGATYYSHKALRADVVIQKLRRRLALPT